MIVYNTDEKIMKNFPIYTEYFNLWYLSNEIID